MDGIGGMNIPYVGFDGSSGLIIWLETSNWNSKIITGSRINSGFPFFSSKFRLQKSGIKRSRAILISLIDSNGGVARSRYYVG